MSEHADLVQQYFDNHAQSWHDYYQSDQSLTNIILKDRMRIGLSFLTKYLPPEPGLRILDAGCGSGLIGVAMAQRGYHVDGWDISEKMIALSRENFSEAGISPDQYKITAGNLLESDLEAGSYNGIMALGFLQYQPDEIQALKFFHQLLRPDGVLVISGPVGVKLSNYFGLGEKIKEKRRARRQKIAPKTTTAIEREHLQAISTNNYSTHRFKELLRAAEFEFLAHRGHGYAHFDFLSRRLPSRHQKRLHLLLTKASKIIPIQEYANDMVVVARRPYTI